MKYSHVFQPITLAGTQFRNRIFSAPIGLEYYPNESCHPGDDFIAFYERKASGGAATVCVGSVMADNSRGAVGPTARLDDPTALSPMFHLAQCISRHGAVADVELQHCGPNAYHSFYGLGNRIYGAVDMVNSMGMEIPAMPESVILDTIEKYGDAAQVAKHVGFGMVTVHAGHGWLLNQFLSPSNNRTDIWGGSMENRARFVNAIADNIKKKCGKGFPVCVRISGSEIFRGGYDIAYGTEIARQLDGHYDMINVSVGAHEAPDVFTVTHPSMFLPDGCNVRYAAQVKQAVKYSRVAAVGAIAEPELMEEIIASGQADVVMLCRQLMADPDTPIKAQCGKQDEIRKCLRCFECFSSAFTKLSHCCAVNPEIGFEREVKYAPEQARFKKKILIAGGGPGGMQAALTAHERGHQVILCEASERLGGALRCEEHVPFKQNTQRYLDTQAHMIEKLGIETHLNTKLTPDMARQIAPDVIIAAIGSRPIKPGIPGIDGKNVLSADYAYLHADEVGRRAVVLGGGLSGMELAIYLAGLGRHVTIVEMADSLNFAGNVIHSMAVYPELERLGVKVATSTRCVRIDETGVYGEYVGSSFSLPGPCDTLKKGMLESVVNKTALSREKAPAEESFFPADTVIYALGQAARRDEAEALRGCAPEFYALGDCTQPRNIYAATSTAFTVARDIGRF